MKYCSKCKRLHNDEETVCKSCKAQLKTITDENTPVYLLTASGFELQRVKAALEDSTVPCDATIRKCVENRYNANAATGYDNSSYDVYVPYSAYEKLLIPAWESVQSSLRAKKFLTMTRSIPKIKATHLMISLKK